MNKFIKINCWYEGIIKYINIDKVEGFYRYDGDDYTTICCGKYEIRSKETPEEILKLINEVR